MPGLFAHAALAAAAPALTSADDVLAGLRAPRRELPPRLLRDDAGAELYEEVTRLPAHYVSWAELDLLRAHAGPLARHVGAGARIVEAACGEGVSARVLLRGLERPASYVPVDAAPAQLAGLAAELRRRHPALRVEPVTADATRPFVLPAPACGRTLVVLGGATLDMLAPPDARALLVALGEVAGPDRLLLLGADGTRDATRLVPAWEDERGVVAAYARSALAHLNRTRGATFAPGAFALRVRWRAAHARLDVQLVSEARQLVRVDGELVPFAAGEAVTVRSQHQHAPAALDVLLASAGWRPRHVFTHADVPYRLWLCEPVPRSGRAASGR